MKGLQNTELKACFSLTFSVIRKCIVDELEMTVGLTWSPQNLRELTQESDKSRKRARPVCSESQRRRGRRRGGAGAGDGVRGQEWR